MGISDLPCPYEDFWFLSQTTFLQSFQFLWMVTPSFSVLGWEILASSLTLFFFKSHIQFNSKFGFSNQNIQRLTISHWLPCYHSLPYHYLWPSLLQSYGRFAGLQMPWLTLCIFLFLQHWPYLFMEVQSILLKHKIMPVLLWKLSNAPFFHSEN